MLRYFAVAILALGTLSAQSSESQVLIETEFVGFERIASMRENLPVAAKWNRIWTNSATVAFRTKALRRTGRIPQLLLGERLEGKNVDYSAFFQTGAEELLAKPTFLRWRTNPNAPDHTEWVLAARLGLERTRSWDTNCWTLIESWDLGQLNRQSGDASSRIASWISTIRDSAYNVRFTRWQEWIFIGSGSHGFPLFNEIFEQARKGELLQQKDAWLRVEAAFSAMKAFWPVLRDHNGPDIRLTISPLETHVRNEISASFEKPLPFEADEWKLPEDIVKEPIGSFTAVRGIRHLWTRFLGEEENPPNQYYAWSQSNIPFQTFAAVPVADPTNRVHALSERWLEEWSNWAKTNKLGSINWIGERNEIFWKGLPAITPFVRPMQPEGKQDGYLMAGMFPPVIKGKPAPKELFDQIRGRSDLVYYAWEITQTRLEQLQQLMQLLYLVFMDRQVALVSPSQNWIKTIAPELGNTITEITSTSETEFKLTRRSHIGLSSTEMMALALLIEDPAYPDGLFTNQKAPFTPSKKKSPVSPPSEAKQQKAPHAETRR